VRRGQSSNGFSHDAYLHHTRSFKGTEKSPEPPFLGLLGFHLFFMPSTFRMQISQRKTLLTPALCYGFCHAKSGFQTLCTKHQKRKRRKTHVHPLCVTLQTLHPIMCHKGWIPYHQITRARTYTLWATDIGAYNVDIDL
jgi:hypothetical protein